MSTLFSCNRPIRIATVTTILCVVIRSLQKAFLIYPRTGFFVEMEWSYGLLLCIMGIGCMMVYTSIKKKSLVQPTKMHCQPLAWFSLFTAGAILVDTISWYVDPPYLDPLIIMSPLVLQATSVMGILSAIVMVKLSGEYRKGIAFSEGNWVMVFLPLWQAGRTVLRFAYYNQVTTLSDNMLETLFMILCTLFLMHHAYSCVGISRSSHSTLWTGLALGIVGLPLVAGQMVTFIMKPSLYGPSMASCMWMFTISLYSLVFIDHLLHLTEVTEE